MDEETKREAERIVRKLGIPMSSAIYAFLKAVPPYPYEGGLAKIRNAELSEPSLKSLRELEEGKVEPY